MKITFAGNCQVRPLRLFVERALPHHEYRHIEQFAADLGYISPQEVYETFQWADLIFYHIKSDDPNDYPSRQPKVPLPVWYQSAPFIEWASGDSWKEVEERYDKFGMEEACRFAAHDANMNYEKRWQTCLGHQIKREKESVPEVLWISHLMEQGRTIQMQATQNHPTSFVFREWALGVCRYLDEKPGPNAVSLDEAIANINIADMPCEDTVPSAARKVLGLSWSTRPDSDANAMKIARLYLENTTEWSATARA